MSRRAFLLGVVVGAGVTACCSWIAWLIEDRSREVATAQLAPLARPGARVSRPLLLIDEDAPSSWSPAPGWRRASEDSLVPEMPPGTQPREFNGIPYYVIPLQQNAQVVNGRGDGSGDIQYLTVVESSAPERVPGSCRETAR